MTVENPASATAVTDEETSREAVLPFTVVGVGASAGGLEALQSFFQSVPADSGMAFMVIQHLSPDFKSMMVELLGRHSTVEVVQATEDMEVTADRIYLLPPKKDLRLRDGRIALSDRGITSGLHLPIDIFLHSLADEQGEQSVAVILSGTGTDGTRGIRAVKEAGGVVMVQDPSTAKFDGMPNSAIATGLADVVLAPESLSSELVRLTAHPLVPIQDPDRFEEEQQAVRSVLSLLRQVRGVDFSLYKSATILRRLSRRVAVGHCNSTAEYVERLRHDSKEQETLFRELVIGVTRFFRDREAWDSLAELVIPSLVRDAPDGATIRVWVPACSTGEEAYSVAMLLDDYLRTARRPVHYRVFATDVNRESLVFAGGGNYAEGDCAFIPTHLREQYLEPRTPGRLAITRPLRVNVTFAEHNLLTDPPFTRLDLTLCRNLLIYFTPEVQQQVLSRMHFGLRPKGFLFLGSSETVGESSSRFRTVSSKTKIFQRIGSGQTYSSGGLLSNSGRRLRTVPIARSNGRQPPSDALYEAVLSHYVPPGVAVDPQFDVLYLFGGASRYLSLPTGRLNLNLLKMLPQATSVVVSSSARKAQRTKAEARVPNVEVPLDQGTTRVDLRVIPVDNLPGFEQVLMIFFEDKVAVPEASSHSTIDISDDVAQRVRELEEELTITRENLHTAVQDLESSNEELQATNEELVASNEELQSTNEELQSVNEELYTVNTEHQRKISELEDLNTDLESLLSGIDVGVAFLDHNLRIRRYNNFARRLLPLRDLDVGRPLSELAIRAHYPDFIEDVTQVRDRRVTIQRDVVGPSDSHWRVTVTPLERGLSEESGVLAAFYDNTEQVAEKEHFRRLAWAFDAVDSAEDRAHFIIHPGGGGVEWSPHAAPLLGLEVGSEPSWTELLDRLSPGSRELALRSVEDAMDGNMASFENTWILSTNDGAEIRLRALLQPIEVEGREGIVILGSLERALDEPADPPEQS